MDGQKLRPIEPAKWLAALCQRLAPARERRLVWVQGSPDDTRQWVREATELLTTDTLLWVGEESGAIAPGEALQHLGREYGVLVWDGFCGLHPDGFAALAGTLRGGGVLILMGPEGDHWHELDDPDYRRLASAPRHKHFLARFARILAAAPAVLPVSRGAPLPQLPDPGAAMPQTLPTVEQQQALAAIMKVRLGHRRRPLVITADRGRGKSAIMGIAAARLIARDALTVVVTAARPSALASFWHHAAATLGESIDPALLQHSPGQIRHGEGSIRFYSPAHLLEAAPQADLLLVDEAATIPVPVLAGLLGRYARVVFASTVHGYEGSGRGFTLRFQDHLSRQAPGWQALSLQEPVRWSGADPLEPLLNRLLLLDAELPGHENGDVTGRVEVVSWSRAERAESEERLKAVFGLLVNAHYQTTPDDLRLLLDDPDSQCWLALQGAEVVGALWVMAEGGLEPTLAEKVRRGQRRTRGHLLPQALAAYGGDSKAAELRYWRVVRIAVHPQKRRQGLGQRLVAAAAESARVAGIDVLGTSFGVSPELVDFWRRCEFGCLRLGLRRDAASGTFSLMLGQGLTPAGHGLCARQRDRFAEYWPNLLTTELQSLAPALVWQLSPAWHSGAGCWNSQDRLEVEDFAFAARPLALTRVALQRLTWQCLPRLPEMLGDDAVLWCRAIVQQVPEAGWQAEGLVSGRKDGFARLQQAAKIMLAETPVAKTPG